MEERKINGFAIASLVLGIVGLCCEGLICGILAIVFARVSKRDFGPTGMARAGKILGILAIIKIFVVVVLVILLMVGIYNNTELMSDIIFSGGGI